MRVDIVSDVVCPWCAVGYYQLAVAARETEIALDVNWHPFQLNPQVGPEGENLRDHLAAKYGQTPEDSVRNRERLSAIGAEVGFSFNFTDETRTWNTLAAHQLIHWAAAQNRGTAMKLALLKANFTDNRNVSDLDVLAEIAGDAGFDAEVARDILASRALEKPVLDEMRYWHDNGVRGVPTMIFLGRYKVTGAQGVANYRSILEQLSEMAE